MKTLWPSKGYPQNWSWLKITKYYYEVDLLVMLDITAWVIVCCSDILYVTAIYCMLQLYIVCYSYILYATAIYCMLQLYIVCYSYILYVTAIYCMLQLYIVCYSYILYVTGTVRGRGRWMNYYRIWRLKRVTSKPWNEQKKTCRIYMYMCVCVFMYEPHPRISFVIGPYYCIILSIILKMLLVCGKAVKYYIFHPDYEGNK